MGDDSFVYNGTALSCVMDHSMIESVCPSRCRGSWNANLVVAMLFRCSRYDGMVSGFFHCGVSSPSQTDSIIANACILFHLLSSRRRVMKGSSGNVRAIAALLWPSMRCCWRCRWDQEMSWDWRIRCGRACALASWLGSPYCWLIVDFAFWKLMCHCFFCCHLIECDGKGLNATLKFDNCAN